MKIGQLKVFRLKDWYFSLSNASKKDNKTERLLKDS
jgi:hypothetical protein